MTKAFRLRENDIRNLVREGRGSGLVSDLVTVSGYPVSWMYRQPAIGEFSGWCFFSDLEDERYLADPGHFGIYDLNVIANYDPSIIELLDEAPGSAYARRGPLAPLELVTRAFRPADPTRRGLDADQPLSASG